MEDFIKTSNINIKSLQEIVTNLKNMGLKGILFELQGYALKHYEKEPNICKIDLFYVLLA